MNFSVLEEERKALLSAARESIESALEQRSPQWADTPPSLTIPRGAFVTLSEGKRLRGCIGRLTPSGPLMDTVRSMARAAAFEDPRFPAVTRDEWPSVSIEISVLGPMERLSSTDEIVIGQHGLYIVQGFRAGVLLPQVATEWGWNRDEFLIQVCHKAGLPSGAWKEPSTELYRFEAAVFGEKE
jgi:AmmeMemoRadiSam system protein A